MYIPEFLIGVVVGVVATFGFFILWGLMFAKKDL